MPKDLEWLAGLPKFSQPRYNLYRMWLLLNKFALKAEDFQIYFITGSKGKGTVASTLAAILSRAGVPTGLFTSPHLVSVCERVNFNGDDIEEEALRSYLGKVRRGLPPLPDKFGSWIFSEILLVTALLWYTDMSAQTVVLEAGLGGRLDSANHFRRPLATCITTVSLEHRGILGNSVEEIAREKAGILKPFTPVVTGAQGSSLQVILERAKLFSAPALVYGREFAWDSPGRQLVLPGKTISTCVEDTEAGCMNRALAACLAGFHPRVTPEAIAEGIQAQQLPGRFEVYSGPPVYILDVAHTPESVDNLLQKIRLKFPGGRLACVAGFLMDKPVETMLNQMAAAADYLYYASVQDERSFDAPLLPQGIRAESISHAIEEAASNAELICVTGSFAAVREARILLSKRF